MDAGNRLIPGRTYWQLMQLQSGGYSQRVYETEEEASFACARINQQGKANSMGDMWTVVSFVELDNGQ